MKALEDVKNDQMLTLSFEKVPRNMTRLCCFWAGISSSRLTPSVQCSLLGHEGSSITERGYEGESRFVFRRTRDVI